MKKGIDKEVFKQMFFLAQRSRSVLIHNCYNDLFSGIVQYKIVINFIFLDSGIRITRNMVSRIKKQFDNIEIQYEPLWRPNIIPQMGNRIEKKPTENLLKISENKKEIAVYNKINNDEENIDLTLFDVTESRFGKLILPKNHTRKFNPHREIKYHISLKNYTFPYPWKELDPLGIPYPAEIEDGEFDEYGRDRFFLDIVEYHKIKDNYLIPEQWDSFMKRNSSLFQKYRQSGIPSSKGGFNPNPEIDNEIV